MIWVEPGRTPSPHAQGSATGAEHRILGSQAQGRVLATLLCSVVWAGRPVALSALLLLQAALPPPGSSHSTRSLTLELGRTGPARRLPQRRPRPGAVQLPQFQQSRRPNPQPTPHHSLALDLGGMQHRKGSWPWAASGQTTAANPGSTQASLASALTSPPGTHSGQWSLPGPGPEGF